MRLLPLLLSKDIDIEVAGIAGFLSAVICMACIGDFTSLLSLSLSAAAVALIFILVITLMSSLRLSLLGKTTEPLSLSVAFVTDCMYKYSELRYINSRTMATRRINRKIRDR